MVKVQAHGYSDDGCTRLTSPAERSDAVNAMFEVPVHLFLFVKVRANWADDPERYREMGLDWTK